MTEKQSTFDKFNYWMKTSIGLRIFTIAFLVLVLLIPVNMVESLIWERKNYREQVLNEISGKWGREQTVSGLVMTIPFYRYSVTKNDDGTEKTIRSTYHAHFLPSLLDIDGDVLPEKRKRGIYEVVVYSSDLALNGTFDRPDFSKLGIDESNVQWSQTKVSLGLTDLRSIQNEVLLDWSGKSYNFEPGTPDDDVFTSGISTSVPVDDSTQAYSFAFDLSFNGSNGLRFTPLGKKTTVSLESTWPDPKFDGAFITDSNEVTKDGFEADWEIFQLNRNYPQEFEGSNSQIASSSFGVELLMPVDHYQKSTRSVKYAVLFITLTFLVYFFAQLQNKVRIHPIQYLIVGLAICLFFTILIALSEHIGFGWAYLIGSTAIIGMITTYSQSIFKNMRLTMILAGIMIVIYGFIYIIIQMQGYSLLIGSIGLFFILAIVMYISRNIDWYSIGKKAADQISPSD